MPKGVGRSVGWQKSDVEGSTGISFIGDSEGEGAAMAIAVDMR